MKCRGTSPSGCETVTLFLFPRDDSERTAPLMLDGPGSEQAYSPDPWRPAWDGESTNEFRARMARLDREHPDPEA